VRIRTDRRVFDRVVSIHCCDCGYGYGRQGERVEETLEQKRDKLAQSRYGESYYSLCSIRKDVINKLIRMEEER